MTDVSDTILAKSDQLNAVDLPPQCLTATINKVTKHRAEQPVSIHLDGFDGRPYKPCLSMRRVLCQAWGTKSELWVGRSMSLFCDNDVKWAGKEVGGIRISHLSNINGKLKLPIAISKHVRAMYEVMPLDVSNIQAVKTDPEIVEKINNQESEADLVDLWGTFDTEQQEAHKAVFSKRRAEVK